MCYGLELYAQLFCNFEKHLKLVSCTQIGPFYIKHLPGLFMKLNYNQAVQLILYYIMHCGDFYFPTNINHMLVGIIMAKDTPIKKYSDEITSG